MAQDVKTLNLIKSNKLFDYVNPDELQLPFNAKDVVMVNDGDIIYQTGDSAEQIYLILEGAVKIKHSIAIDGQRIFEKGQGEFFGEKEFMDRDSRNSSAVAIRDSKLYVFRRKELNNLFAKHRTLLNNIQGTDPTKDEHADFRNTRDSYPDEITNLLKTSESSLDPYRYRAPNQSVDMTGGSKEHNTAEVVAKQEMPIELPKAEEFPQRFKSTFEDSFTFGDFDKVIDAMDKPKAAEPATIEESASAEKPEFSWDFSHLGDIVDEPVVPVEESKAEPAEIQEPIETFSFQDDAAAKLGFHFPSDQETELTEPKSDFTESAWKFQDEEIPVPESTESAEELPEEDEKFSWDFSDPSFEEKILGAEEEVQKSSTNEITEKPDSFQWSFEQEAVDQSVATVAPEWNFDSGESTPAETEPLIANPFSFDLPAEPESTETEAPVAEFTSPLKEPVWDLDDLSDDIPIHGGTFDEFGNLIPEEAVIAELPEIADIPEPVEQMPAVFPADQGAVNEEPKSAHIFAEHEEDKQALHDHIWQTDLEGNKLVTDKPAEDNKFGTQGFTFTAPLEVRQPVTQSAENKDVDETRQAYENLTKENLHLIIEAAKMVNSNVKLDEVLNQIVLAASLITSADRGTLYIVDNSAEELWSKIIRGEEIEEIRLKLGQGIAGWVAKTGETVNIKDAAADARFDSNIDKVTGYKTKSMLCYAIKNKSGVIIAVIQLLNSKNGVFSDLDEVFLEALSAHIAISLENAELVEQLLKTDRLTSLGKVAKFLISDIKKPILTIKQLAEHIRKKNVSPETNQVLGLMIEQSNIVVDLVLTTLSYSEGKTILNKKVLGLHRVLDELLDLLAEYVEYRKTKLFKKYGPDVLINVDRREMYQAFFQITKNACDAMPQGGELYVAAKLAEAGDVVQISFKDKGVGIPSGVLEKLFEPFMAHGKSNGVGLGLPITEKIVKEHEGFITVDSKLGEGTTVTITLPVVKEF